MNDRALAYIDDDGAVTIRASAVGKCSRSLWAALEEIDPVAPTERIDLILSEGYLHEQAVRELLESEGAIVEDQAEITLWIIPGRLKVVGHVDGKITNWYQVWENKALGKESFKRWRNVGFDAFPDYAWQISVYMLSLNLPALYTVKCRDDGELDRMVIDQPPVSLTEIRAKLVGLYSAYKRGEMPPCDPERWMCSFYFLHDEIAEGETFELDDPYYESAASRLADVREQLKFLLAIEKDLKNDLNSLAVGVHVAGDYEIEVTQVTQNRHDQNKMIEAGLNPNDYKSESSYRTVRVKEKR
jgi:hypothetical protein